MAKILVIDDDELIRRVLRVQLEGQGHEVHEGEDGKDGLNQAIRKKPDLILLDMNMPGMTGFEVLPKLRGDEATASIPVIALTAHDTNESRDEAHKAGCDRFVSKPIDPKRVFAAVDEALEKS